jgi:hypothetical protein
VHPEVFGKFKKSAHQVLNLRPSFSLHSALTTMLPLAPLVLPRQYPKNSPRPTFLKLRNHSFIKFTLYDLSFQHKFAMNNTFGIKNSVKIISPAIFAFSHFLSIRFHWIQPSCTLTSCFWIVYETPASSNNCSPF